MYSVQYNYQMCLATRCTIQMLHFYNPFQTANFNGICRFPLLYTHGNNFWKSIDNVYPRNRMELSEFKFNEMITSSSNSLSALLAPTLEFITASPEPHHSCNTRSIGHWIRLRRSKVADIGTSKPEPFHLSTLHFPAFYLYSSQEGGLINHYHSIAPMPEVHGQRCRNRDRTSAEMDGTHSIWSSGC